jgi:agmatinase
MPEEERPVSGGVNPVPVGSPTLLDVPRCTDLAALEADLAIVGVPFGVPYDLYRSSLASVAPAAIRQHSLFFSPRYLSHYDYDFGGDLFAGRQVRIADCGDVAMAPGRWEENCRAVTAVVRTILDRGAVPIALGGEDSTPIPVLRAYEGRGPICIVQVDAHIDWRDELGGIRQGLSSTMRRASEMPWVAGMMQVGIRGFGSARKLEFDDARRYGSVLVGADEVHRLGIEMVLERLPVAERYYITVDLDAFDPTIAPAVQSPAFGGLTYGEGAKLLRGVAARGRIAGFDLVEIIPSADTNGITSRLAAQLILVLIGAMCHTGQIGAVTSGRGDAGRA